MMISPCPKVTPLWLVLGASLCCSGTLPTSRDVCVRFDATIELNAPICRTHIVLFARYWVSPRFYRLAVVWAEPHAGNLNFAIYPPTLTLASDPNCFSISHQFQHMYDGVFGKPLGGRGPFRHRFNSYFLNDIRFAEQEALAQRVQKNDMKELAEGGGEGCERVLEISRGDDEVRVKADVGQMKVRTSHGRLEEMRLFDTKGRLVKSLQYEYANEQRHSPLLGQRVFLPERPITVGFGDAGPTITIAGETRQYSELETVHHRGGRNCVVDYRLQGIGGRTLSLPVRIVVHPGDQGQV